MAWCCRATSHHLTDDEWNLFRHIAWSRATTGSAIWLTLCTRPFLRGFLDINFLQFGWNLNNFFFHEIPSHLSERLGAERTGNHLKQWWLSALNAYVRHLTTRPQWIKILPPSDALVRQWPSSKLVWTNPAPSHFLNKTKVDFQNSITSWLWW